MPAPPRALLDCDLPDAQALLFERVETVLECRSPAQVDAAFAQLDQARAAGRWGVLAAAYELGFLYEPTALPTPAADAVLLTVLVCAPPQRLGAAARDQWLARAGAGAAPAGVCELAPGIARGDYLAAVERIRALIAAGDCYQVNFTFPLTMRAFGDPLALYAKLAARQPVRHGGLLQWGGRSVLSLSPELFVQRAGATLSARPMKGTAPRAAARDADAAARDALAASAKERAENVMIVDLIRNDFGRIAQAGSVRVPALFDIEPYPTVWQMTSTVTARAPGVPLAQVLRVLFPCGSVTGAPKIRAMQIIHALEAAPRGLYTGTIGWIAPDGDFSLNVAIRTLDIGADGAARMGVGSGITWDSEPAREYEECLWKARFLTGADPGFRLIETLRAEAGAIPLVDLHLARLAASAAHFGFACDLPAIRARLAARAAALPPAPHRLRLTLGHDGDFEDSAAPLDLPPVAPLLLRLSGEALDSSDEFLRHKTTWRPAYDAALRRIAAEPALFDELFANERGELCEGARANLFIDLDGVLCTPPLASGLLPGVLRAKLLAEGRAVERTLYRDDLARATRIFMGNALRGLVAVHLAD